MYFITENELKARMRHSAIKQFHLSQDERLTPEARQFLLDKKISLHFEDEATVGETSQVLLTNQSSSWRNYFWELLEIELLEAAKLAAKTQFSISQELFDLAQQLLELKKLELEASPSDSAVEINHLPPLKLSLIHLLSEQGELLLKLKRIKNTLTLLCEQTTAEQKKQLLPISQTIDQLMLQLIGV